MVVILFRTRLNPDADMAELARLGERMFSIASSSPGYVSYKEFQAADGESVSIVEFASLETLAAWRDHPEHRQVQDRARREFLAEYKVQVCTQVRASSFPAG
jgi:heme-degrading monooxygenase HmoA